MIPNEYITDGQKRIRKYSDFIDKVDEDFFSEKALEELSLDQIAARYHLAKEMMNKEVDNAIKIAKSEENLNPEMKVLMGAILSLNIVEREQLKRFIREIKKESK